MNDLKKWGMITLISLLGIAVYKNFVRGMLPAGVQQFLGQ